MAEIRRCNRCGNLLPSDAPEGTCPACLLQAGLAGGAPAEGDQDWHGMPDTTAEVVSPLSLAATSAPGVLATLAETVADIPRVHLRDTETITGPGPVVRPSSGELPDPSDRVARLQLLGEVARGGMGVIIKGRDSDLGRDLAVKVLLDEHREKPDLIRRFVEEAQISGQLQHPGVVPVYELGTLADHRPYFAMKLVKGRTLAALLAERQVEGYPSVGGGSVRRSDRGTEAPPTGGPSPGHGLPRFLSIFEQVCQTMAFADARGVIHRDLKPSNIMAGSFGEVQVMDWGLAKVLPEGGRRRRGQGAAGSRSRDHDGAERLCGQRRRVAGGQRTGDTGLHGARGGARRNRPDRRIWRGSGWCAWRRRPEWSPRP